MSTFGTAVILAGGQSSRMGFDKQFLQLGSKNILSYISEKLSGIFNEIIVVSNTLTASRYEGFVVVADQIKGKGPLSGIHSGLLSAKSDYVYFVACDMPVINLAYIEFMEKEILTQNNKVLACVTRFKDWIEPFNSFYHKDLAQLIESHLQTSKSIYSLIAKVNCLYIPEEVARTYSPNWDMFLNLNTQEDLSRFAQAHTDTSTYERNC